MAVAMQFKTEGTGRISTLQWYDITAGELYGDISIGLTCLCVAMCVCVYIPPKWGSRTPTLRTVVPEQWGRAQLGQLY